MCNMDKILGEGEYEYVAIRAWKKTRDALKLLASLRKQSMFECLDELVEKELQEAMGREAKQYTEKEQ